MTRPNIQIDDEVREMTDEEYALYRETIKKIEPLAEASEE